MGALGNTILTGYVSVAATMLILRHVIRSTGVTIFLQGLRCYFTTIPADATQPSSDGQPSKRERKQAKQLDLKGVDDQIFVQPLGPQTMKKLEHMEDFENMVVVSAMLLNTTLLNSAAVAFLGLADNPVILNITAPVVLYVAFVWAKIKPEMTSASNDRIYLLLFVMGGFLVSWYCLWWAPTSLFAFDLGQATHSFDKVVNAMIARFSRRLDQGMPLPSIRTNRANMALGLSMQAGLLAGCLLGPAIRFARLLFNATHVPEWGANHLKRHWLRLRIVQLAFALPLLVTFLQIRPLYQYLGLTDAWVKHLLPVAYLAVGLSHLLSVYPLCQTWLDNGLLTWHMLKYDGIERKQRPLLTYLRLDYLRLMLGRVATELMGMVPLMLSVSFMLLLSNGALQSSSLVATRHMLYQALPAHLQEMLASILTSPDSQQAEDDAAFTTVDSSGPSEGAMRDQTSAAVLAGDLYTFLGSFYGWWACTVWCLYAFSTLAVYRLGLNSG